MLSGDELRQYLRDNNTRPLTQPTNGDGSNTNWQKPVERTSYSTNHNLSFIGAALGGNTLLAPFSGLLSLGAKSVRR